jgi:hypothetical protein
MKKAILLLIGVIGLSGCFPHQVWKDANDKYVGTKFDPASARNSETRDLYTQSYNYTKEGVFYYQVVQEPPNLRYYIKWSWKCRYSLLVAPDGTILSWRYEDVREPSDCYAI